MLESCFLSAANYLLNRAGWARKKLMPHAGRTAKLVVGGEEILFSVATDGHLTKWLSPERKTDITLHVPLTALPSLAMNGADDVMKNIRVDGNAEFADAIGFVLRNLRWDYEEDLSAFFGDIIAHRLTETARAGKRFASRTLDQMVRRIIEEKNWVVSRSEYRAHADHLTEATHALDTLERRLASLEPAKGLR